MDSRRACGLDDIRAIVLNKRPRERVPVLCKLSDKCLAPSSFLSCWKFSSVAIDIAKFNQPSDSSTSV